MPNFNYNLNNRRLISIRTGLSKMSLEIMQDLLDLLIKLDLLKIEINQDQASIKIRDFENEWIELRKPLMVESTLREVFKNLGVEKDLCKFYEENSYYFNELFIDMRLAYNDIPDDFKPLVREYFIKQCAGGYNKDLLRKLPWLFKDPNILPPEVKQAVNDYMLRNKTQIDKYSTRDLELQVILTVLCPSFYTHKDEGFLPLAKKKGGPGGSISIMPTPPFTVVYGKEQGENADQLEILHRSSELGQIKVGANIQFKKEERRRRGGTERVEGEITAVLESPLRVTYKDSKTDQEHTIVQGQKGYWYELDLLKNNMGISKRYNDRGEIDFVVAHLDKKSGQVIETGRVSGAERRNNQVTIYADTIEEGRKLLVVKDVDETDVTNQRVIVCELLLNRFSGHRSYDI